MKTFNYSSKASIKDNLTEILIGAALIIGPIVYPFGIKIGATRILGPLPTAIILAIAGLFMLFKAWQKIRQARTLAAKGCVITVDNSKVTYPVIQKGTITQGLFAFSDISLLNYDEEDGILTVTLADGNKVKFDVDFFDSLSHLKEFAALIQK